MRRFNYDDSNEDLKKEVERFYSKMNEYEDSDDDEFDDDDLDMDGEDGEYLIHNNDLMSALQAEFKYREINLTLLSVTIEMVKKTIFWRFMPIPKKIQRIVEAYTAFSNLVNQGGK